MKKAISRWLQNLRFPVLLLVTGGLFLLNLLVPDPIPFVDEILLGLVTAVLARTRRKPATEQQPDPPK